MAKKRKSQKSKKSKIPKKYLSGLKGSKRSARAKLLTTMGKMYKAGMRIPLSMFKARVK
jgi:hypothetical protein